MEKLLVLLLRELDTSAMAPPESEALLVVNIVVDSAITALLEPPYTPPPCTAVFDSNESPVRDRVLASKHTPPPVSDATLPFQVEPADVTVLLLTALTPPPSWASFSVNAQPVRVMLAFVQIPPPDIAAVLMYQVRLVAVISAVAYTPPPIWSA
jgi:hypothetical protein